MHTRAFDRWIAATPLPHLLGWVSDLEASPPGELKLLLHSIRREFVFGNWQIDELKQTFVGLDESIGKSVKSPREACRILREFVCLQRAAYGQKLSTAGNKVDVSAWRGCGVRLMARSRFLDMVKRKLPTHTARSAVDRLRAKLWEPRGPRAAAIDDYLLELVASNRLGSEDLAEGQVVLMGRDGFFWASVTDSLGLKPQARFPEPDPDIVQKRVGVAYPNDWLIAVFFPLDGEPGNEPRAPTLLNAGGTNPYFRPAWRHDCWGEAVDLHTLDSGAVECVKLDLAWRRDWPDPHHFGRPLGAPFELSDDQWTRLLSQSELQFSGWLSSSRACCPHATAMRDG